MPGEHTWNGNCQLVRQKIECRHAYWLNEWTVLKQPKALSLGSLSPQLSPVEHKEPYVCLTQLCKPRTFIFTGLWWIRHYGLRHFEGFLPHRVSADWGEDLPASPRGSKEVSTKVGGTQQPSNWSSLSQLCPPLQDILHKAVDRSLWRWAFGHITSLIIPLKASFWVEIISPQWLTRPSSSAPACLSSGSLSPSPSNPRSRLDLSFSVPQTALYLTELLPALPWSSLCLEQFSPVSSLG